MSAPIWNDKSELSYESYYVSGIQDYFDYFLKSHNEKIDNKKICK